MTSSLVYLQRLPVVEIKADRSFVTTMCSVKDDAIIVRSIIDLAHNLGLKVVAEGVEDRATMNLLNEYGCDEAQGYYFSRLVPGDHLLHWLETSAFGLPRPVIAGTRAAVAVGADVRASTSAARPLPHQPRAARRIDGASAPSATASDETAPIRELRPHSDQEGS